MSEEIFEIYEFIKNNKFETHCYDYNNIDKDKEKEIIVFIEPWNSKAFLECINNNASCALEDGGYNITITNGGNLCVELFEIITMYCNNDESEKWFNRFKKYSFENF